MGICLFFIKDGKKVENKELDKIIQTIASDTISDNNYNTPFQKDLLNEDLKELIATNIRDKIQFNSCSKTEIDVLKKLIFEGSIKDSRMCAFIRTNKITSMFEMISFFKNKHHVNIHDASNSGEKFVISNVTYSDIHEFRAFYEDGISLVTLGIENLEKMKMLVDEKRFSRSKDQKFKSSGKTYKISIRAWDNISQRELRDRASHYQNVMRKTCEFLTREGYEPKLGMSGGIPEAGIVMYTDEVPNMNRLKLFGISKFAIGINEDDVIVTDAQFEELFSYFIES